jgi:hypothetical protein
MPCIDSDNPFGPTSGGGHRSEPRNDLNMLFPEVPDLLLCAVHLLFNQTPNILVNQYKLFHTSQSMSKEQYALILCGSCQGHGVRDRSFRDHLAKHGRDYEGGEFHQRKELYHRELR